MTAIVTAVHLSPTHTMSKPTAPAIHLIEGIGIDGDAHRGETVKHRSRVRRDPTTPNLRQVHLIHAELHDELRTRGYDIAPGQIGENITTRDLDLLALPAGARLHLGSDAIIEVTGLRNPCDQLEAIQPGLMQAVLDRDEDGNLIRKAGIMAIVLTGGTVTVGDTIEVELPSEPHRPLEPV